MAVCVDHELTSTKVSIVKLEYLHILKLSGAITTVQELPSSWQPPRISLPYKGQ
jgi:hypothetical protein